MKSKKPLFIGAGALLLLVVLGVAARGPSDDSDAFAWDTVSRGDIRETLTASGEIRAKTQINVGTTVLGEIKQIHVVDGQNVKAGDLLVTIDQERLRQEMTRAEAALEASSKDAARAQASMKRAQETQERNESLFKQGLISDEAYRQDKLNRESAEFSFQSAQAGVAQSRASAASMRDSLNKAVLRAPISGRVTGLKAEKGETAIPGQSNLAGATLMVISDMSEMMAEIKVNESEVVRTKVGQTAQITIESLPGRVFQGKVSEVATGSEVNATQGNLYKVKILLEGKQEDLAQLRPGMSARAILLTAEAKNILRIPLQSVQERESSLEEAQKQGLLAPAPKVVVMSMKDGKAMETPVKVGIANTQYYELKEGLSEGARLLTGPSKKLKDLKSQTPIKLKARSDSDLAKLPKGSKP